MEPTLDRRLSTSTYVNERWARVGTLLLTLCSQTSGLAGFCPRTGWALDQLEDLGPVFETEKGLAESFPVRAVSPVRYYV